MTLCNLQYVASCRGSINHEARLQIYKWKNNITLRDFEKKMEISIVENRVEPVFGARCRWEMHASRRRTNLGSRKWSKRVARMQMLSDLALSRYLRTSRFSPHRRGRKREKEKGEREERKMRRIESGQERTWVWSSRISMRSCKLRLLSCAS